MNFEDCFTFTKPHSWLQIEKIMEHVLSLALSIIFLPLGSDKI